MGCAAALHPHWIYLPVLLLLYFRKSLHEIAKGALLLLVGYVYACYCAPGTPTQGVQSGVLSIQSVQPFSSPFQQSLLYRVHFNDHPCLLFQNKQERLIADREYFVDGTLEVKDKGTPVFKLKKMIKPLEETSGLVEWRFKKKEELRHYLSKKIPDQKAAHFLSALLTGDIDDRQLNLEFRKVGLSHLLAISGLDFALLAAFAGWILRRFFPYKVSSALLLIFISGFFFFLGISPSILRAYIAIALYLVARLFDFQTAPLNLLGAALVAELLYDPLTIENVGFQLTFACTLGLLLFYRRFDILLCNFLPKRPLITLQALSFFHQHIALLSGLIRQTLAATLAAHLLALPLCLYHFHVFPLLSLLYNLFFPVASALSLLLCFLALTLGPMGSIIHLLNSLYTGFLMRLVAASPPLLNYSLYVPQVLFPLVISLIAIICKAGLTESPIRAHNGELFHGDRSSVG